MDRGLIEIQARGELGDAQRRAVVAHVKQDAQGFLQGFAGAGLPARRLPLRDRFETTRPGTIPAPRRFHILMPGGAALSI